MSTMAATVRPRRARRQFTDEFKAGAVRLVLDEGKTVGQVARELDLTESALRHWVERERGGPDQRPDRPDDRGTRGVAAPAQGSPDAAYRAGDPKKNRGLLRQGARVAFAFIQAEKASFSVRAMCRILDVSPSGFYAWRDRPASASARRDQQLRVLIRASHKASRCRYGSPRVHEDLREQGEAVSRKRVVRLMQLEGLRARARKRFTSATMRGQDQPVAANVLDRDFSADAPNQRWVADTTEFVIGSSGKLYLEAVLDLFSRFPRRLGGQRHQRPTSRHQGTADGTEAAASAPRTPAPLGPGQPLRERGLPGGSWRRTACWGA